MYILFMYKYFLQQYIKLCQCFISSKTLILLLLQFINSGNASCHECAHMFLRDDWQSGWRYMQGGRSDRYTVWENRTRLRVRRQSLYFIHTPPSTTTTSNVY